MKALMKVLTIALMSQIALALSSGSQCNSTTCTESRGFITYHVGSANNQWTISANEFTRFVVIIRDVQTLNEGPWGLLTQYHHVLPNTYVLDQESRLFTFESTRQVTLSLQNSNILTFRLEYYVGCIILEDRNITIGKKPVLSSLGDQPDDGNSECSNVLSIAQLEYNLWVQREGYFIHPAFQFNTWLSRQPVQSQILLSQCLQQQNQPQTQQDEVEQEATCWIVIPSITDERQEGISFFGLARVTQINVDVQETYLTMQDISTNENTTINVINLMDGTTVNSMQGNASLSVVNMPKSNSTYLLYQKDQLEMQVSTLLLVDLTCQDSEGCNEAGFFFSSYALRQSDLDCIERENKCRFNIGTKNFTCHNNDSFLVSLLDPEYLFEEADENTFTSQECPAYQLFVSTIDSKLNEIDPEDESDIIGRSHGGRKKKIKYCKNRKKFCKTPYCSDFATRGCIKLCVLMKLNAKMCDHIHEYF